MPMSRYVTRRELESHAAREKTIRLVMVLAFLFGLAVVLTQ